MTITGPANYPARCQVCLTLHVGQVVQEQVANRVREQREVRGWTQHHLARQVGVSRQSIISIERGRYVPSLQLALKLAAVFACTTDQLFWLEEDG